MAVGVISMGASAMVSAVDDNKSDWFLLYIQKNGYHLCAKASILLARKMTVWSTVWACRCAACLGDSPGDDGEFDDFPGLHVVSQGRLGAVRRSGSVGPLCHSRCACPQAYSIMRRCLSAGWGAARRQWCA